jgi:hypothetical protein
VEPVPSRRLNPFASTAGHRPGCGVFVPLIVARKVRNGGASSVTSRPGGSVRKLPRSHRWRAQIVGRHAAGPPCFADGFVQWPGVRRVPEHVERARPRTGTFAASDHSTSSAIHETVPHANPSVPTRRRSSSLVIGAAPDHRLAPIVEISGARRPSSSAHVPPAKIRPVPADRPLQL